MPILNMIYWATWSWPTPVIIRIDQSTQVGTFDAWNFTTWAFITDDWLKLYTTNEGDNTLRQYSLSTAFDLSTASLVTSIGTPSAPHWICFKHDWTKAIVPSWWNSNIRVYDLSTAWDLSTATYTDISMWYRCTAACWSYDWTNLYVWNSNASYVHYTLSTPFDLSTRTQESDTITVDTARWCCISKDWGNFFRPRWDRAAIEQMVLTTNYNIGASTDTYYKDASTSGSGGSIFWGNITSDSKYYIWVNKTRYLFLFEF